MTLRPSARKAAGGQFLDERPVERGLAGEVEVLQALEVGQRGEAQVGLDGAGFAGGEFGLEEPAQEVGVAPARGSRLLGDRVELGAGRGGPDLFEGFEGELFVGDAHGGWVSFRGW